MRRAHALLRTSAILVTAAIPWSEASAADSAEAAPQIFAVIVGSNESTSPSLPRLRYADDDAAKFYELFAHLGDARLLTVLDDASQAIYPDLTAQSRVPSLANLDRATAELFRGVEGARARGQATAFYFIYTGHGHLRADMEGYFMLGQDRFTRSDLYQRVLAKSPADHNHILIDACNAYYMVSRRGDYPDDEAPVDFAPFVEAFLATADVSAYPNTGVVLSTSSEAATHEWSLFGAGVFSHEVRSGLLGAADVDNDGVIRYGELAAYIAAANARLENPRSKLQVYAEPPRNDRAIPLMHYRAEGVTSAATLLVEPERSGRLYLEDGRGQRYADLHKAGDGPTEILLLPGQAYHLRGDDFEVVVPEQLTGIIALASLPRRARSDSVSQRGAVDDDFYRNLYAIPFTRNFYEGHAEQATRLRQVMASFARSESDPKVERTANQTPPEPGPAIAPDAGEGWPVAAIILPSVGSGAALLGIAGLGAGGYLLKLAWDDYARFEAAATLERKRELQPAVSSQRNMATALLLSGGTVTAIGLGAVGLGLVLGVLSAEPADAAE